MRKKSNCDFYDRNCDCDLKMFIGLVYRAAEFGQIIVIINQYGYKMLLLFLLLYKNIYCTLLNTNEIRNITIVIFHCKLKKLGIYVF